MRSAQREGSHAAAESRNIHRCQAPFIEVDGENRSRVSRVHVDFPPALQAAGNKRDSVFPRNRQVSGSARQSCNVGRSATRRGRVIPDFGP